MKKDLSILLVMLPLLSVTAQTSFTTVTPSGHTIQCFIDYFAWQPSGIAVSKTSGFSYSGSLVIPDSIYYGGINYPVTTIVSGRLYLNTTGYNSYDAVGFQGLTQLTSIYLPSTITIIYKNAFYGCSGLSVLSLGTNLNEIGENAFSNCSNLNSITIPDSVSYIGPSAFSGCTSLSSLTLSSNAPIADQEFQGCTSLTNVVIPDGVTSIGSSAFSGCTNLTSISIPNSVTSIGSSAFYGCTSLHNLVLPNSLPSIMSSMCQGCSGLENVTIPNTVAYIQSNAFSGCTHLFNITVPNSVLSIETNAFNGVWNVLYNGTATGSTWGALYVNAHLHDSILYNNSTRTSLLRAHWNIHSANIPSTVTSIAAGAFQNCTNISSLAIGNNVQTIGNNAFQGCTGLHTLNYNSNAPYSFVNCTTLTNVTLGNSVTSIGSNMFSGCTGITNLTLGSNIQTIGNSAFYGCSGISSLNIGSSVQSIGSNAFYGCSGITNLTIGSNVQSIGDYAFGSCTGLTTLTYNTTATATWLFYGCTALANVTLGNNVTSIPDGMFYDCTNMNTSPLTNNIQTIGEYAFYNTNISTITIPQSCTFIDSYAFNECPLETVTALPDTHPTIGSGVFSSYPSITVPCGQGSAYRSSWYQYSSLITEPTVDFALNVLTSEGGHAYATSEISCVDSTATISAENDYGYHFDHWSDGNTDNPRAIHVISDTTVTAIFARNSYTITLSSSDEAMGSTTGGGTYLYGDTVSLMAVPVDHYHFMRWRTDYYGYEYSLNENPLEMVVTEDRILTADFAIDTYYVNVIPNEVARGSVTGGGYFEYGSPVTVSASAYSGYQFVRWSNGAEYNPYTFAATNDMTLEAVFMEEGTVYHVEATSDNSVMGTVTGGGPYATGETAILTAVAYPGYHFVRWQDDVTDNPRTITVTQDATFVAYFEANVGIENISDAEIIIYVKDYQIRIDEAFGEEITVYTIDGRTIASLPKATEPVAIPVATAGVYIVKIGNRPARKVVVIR